MGWPWVLLFILSSSCAINLNTSTQTLDHYETKSSRILFLFPLSAYSECNAVHPLVMKLLEKGHQVTWVASVTTGTRHENYTEISPLPPPTVHDYFGGSPNDSILIHRLRQKRVLPFLLAWQLAEINDKCHLVYENPSFKSQVLNQTFDLIFLNGNLHHCLLGLVHRTPYILYTSVPFTGYEFQFWGVRFPRSIVPCVILAYTQNMQFPARLINTALDWILTLTYGWEVVGRAEPVYKAHLEPGLPSMSTLERNVSLIFSNSHPVLSSPRPLTPDIIEIGCLQCRPPRPLELRGELEKFINGADGVVFFSMGSMFQISTFPDDLVRDILQVLSSLKERVVVVADKKDFSKYNSSNLLFIPWVPQQDVLGHSKTRLFISHGGYQSYLEASYHGVPVVMLPINSDQGGAGAHVQEFGHGITLEILHLRKKGFEDAVLDVLRNARYKERAKELSNLFRDQPETPLDRAVFWTEYALRHGGAQVLWSSARGMNAFQYYGIDVYTFILAVVLIIALGMAGIVSKNSNYSALSVTCMIVASFIWQT